MIFLGIGSNLGKRLETMREASRLLAIQGCYTIQASGIYETPAWGGEAEGDFLNAVIEVTFGRSAPELLDVLLELENELGRVREKRWGNRAIDLDLLEFNRETWNHPRLTLPHPGYPTRSFVLKPFADLYPAFIPTGFDQSIAQLLLETDVSDIHCMEDASWILPGN